MINYVSCLVTAASRICLWNDCPHEGDSGEEVMAIPPQAGHPIRFTSRLTAGIESAHCEDR